MAGSEGIRMGKAFVEIGAKTSDLEKGFQNAAIKVEAFGKKIQNIAKTTTIIFAAKLAASVALTKQFASVGDALDKMSIRTGISAKTLSEWGFVAGRCGSELAEIEALMFPLAEKIQRNDQEFKKWGISVEYLKNLLPEGQFLAVADAIKNLSTESEKAAAAAALFGGAGEKLLPMLKLGAAGILELQKQGKKLGTTLSDKEVQSAAELTDAYSDLSVAVQGVTNQLGIALTPIAMGATQVLTNVASATAEWVKQNQNLVVVGSNAFTTISLLGVGAFALGKTLQGISIVISSVGNGFGYLNGAYDVARRTFTAFTQIGTASAQAFRECGVIAGMSAKQLRAWCEASGNAVLAYSQAAQGMATRSAHLVASEEMLTRVGLIKNRTMMTSAEIARRNVASILFMSQAEFRAAAQTKILTAVRKAYNLAANVRAGIANLAIHAALTVRQIAYNTALTSGVAIQKLWTLSLRSDTVASSQSILMRTILAAKNALCTISTMTWTAATQGLTVAVAASAVAMYSTPYGWIIAALAGLVAVVWGVSAAYSSATAEATKFEEAAKKTTLNREQGDETRTLDNMKMERLRQLSEKQKLTNAEMNEARQLTRDLENRYGKLGITLNSFRQTLEMAANAQNRLNREMQRQAMDALEKERDALEKRREVLEKQYWAYDSGAKGMSHTGVVRGFFSAGGWNPLFSSNAQMRKSTAETIGQITDQEKAIQDRLQALQGGNVAALTQHGERERIQQMLAGNGVLEETDEVVKEKKLDLDKTQRELAAIDREKRTEAEQEKYELRKKFDDRQKLLGQSYDDLDLLRQKRGLNEEEWKLLQKIIHAKAELYREEKKQLKELEAKERQQKRELKEQESEKIRSLKKEIQDEKLTQENERLAEEEQKAWNAILEKVDKNPKERSRLQKLMDADISFLENSVQAEEIKLNSLVDAAERDEKLTPEEAKNIDAQRQRLRSENQRLALWKTRRDDLNISDLHRKLQKVSLQDAYFQSDVQTRRQATENAQRLTQPRRKSIDDYAEGIYELLQKVVNCSNQQLQNTKKQFVVEVY